MARKNRRFLSNTPDNDLGIGTQLVGNYRMMDENGNFRVKRKGVFYWHPYKSLLQMDWLKFHVVIFLFYTLINAIFATFYYIIGTESLSGDNYPNFLSQYSKCFFFSVQTLTTVGYGSVAPICFGSNLLAASEALVGLLIFALVTGLYYAKFTRPEAKILYSSHALFSPYKDGLNGLMFRLVNQRNSQLIDVEALVNFSWVEADDEGIQRRRFFQLPLERNGVTLFPLNWTIVHPITEESPLYGKTMEDIKAMNVELLCFIKAYDTAFGNQIQSSISYQHQDMKWAKKFVPMYYADENEGSVIDLDKINEVYDVNLF